VSKVVLIHGNGETTGRDQWFPYVQNSLNDAGVECIAPDMPDPVLARARYWLPYLEELGCDSSTVLVGHSSGAVAAMRYAESHEVEGLVLVGTYYTDLGYDDEKASGYFENAWDWPAIKAHHQWSAIFASTDDPYIPIDEPRYIRDELGAEISPRCLPRHQTCWQFSSPFSQRSYGRYATSYSPIVNRPLSAPGWRGRELLRPLAVSEDGFVDAITRPVLGDSGQHSGLLGATQSHPAAECG